MYNSARIQDRCFKIDEGELQYEKNTQIYSGIVEY